MRLFIGTKISPSLSGKITEFREKWQRLPIRWTQAENLHITLVPPWEAENAAEAMMALDQIKAELRSATCHFEKICVRRHEGKGGIIWLQGQVNADLIALKQALTHAFSATESHDHFLPHVTVARFREAEKSCFPEIDTDLLFTENITNIHLFESRSTVSGNNYLSLFHISLS